MCGAGEEKLRRGGWNKAVAMSPKGICWLNVCPQAKVCQ